MISNNDQDLIQFTEKELAVEEQKDYRGMVKTDGWMKLEKWLIGEIRRLNNLIYFCSIDEVEKYRSEARGMQNILDRVDKIISNKFE